MKRFSINGVLAAMAVLSIVPLTILPMNVAVHPTVKLICEVGFCSFVILLWVNLFRPSR